MTFSPTASTYPIVLAGRYQLSAQLGRGSSAAVYSAVDTRFDRPVTVKLFDPVVASEPGLLARFQRQCAKAARLRHPNIASILDAGVTEESDQGAQPFVVSEPAGSQTLRDLLDREQRLEPQRAVNLARQVAAALSHAHRLSVVHADVKPENVLIEGDRAKLVDFSLSFVSARTGVVTPETIRRRAAYLAPEQVRGDAVSSATDVYGVGVLLYEMVAGRPPFMGSTPRATAERRVNEHARPAGLFEPSIPPALEMAIGRALERSPEDRWPSIEAFDDELKQLGAGQLQPVASAMPPDERPSMLAPKRLLRRLSSPVGLIVPIVAAIVACVLALWFVVPLLRGMPRLGGMFQKTLAPNVVGMSLNDARSLAQSRQLELSVVGDRVSERAPKDVIVQQSPVAGWQVDDGQPVRVTVSAGVQVPDLRGKSVENAAAIVTELGWKIARVERGPHPGYPAGTVALQHPPPGQVMTSPGELLLGVAE
jgi:serine/threonine protein kinase